MNLELELDYFINKRVESRILSEQIRSLQSRKENTRVVIKKPSLKLIDRIESIRIWSSTINREGKVVKDTKRRIQNWILFTKPELIPILEALLIAPSKSRVIIRLDSSAAIFLVKNVLEEPRA
ncbi:26322_t:CDS:2 [Gigaspora margarita]|uniref:26322_t:CDS:1 n=1 Tax=Gigaspora margarita TaxID=4874 RepID=A0ABN7VT89_GIGMA|nr:26322_t:CDS:2 [Gigaspora margarita]